VLSSRDNNPGLLIMPSLKKFFKHRQQTIILALMLEMLHLSIWLDFGSPLSRSFMLVHLGLFLIWQPVWRGDEKLAWYNGLLFIVLTIAFVIWMNWLLLFFWLILLTGFCGGRASIHRRERYINIIVLVFLISELVITSTVSLFDIYISRSVSDAFSIFLPFLPLAIILVPTSDDERSLHTVDFIHATTTALLISLLVIGSLLNMYRSGTEYLVALIQTMIAIGLLLFVISWLLTPHAGFSGLSQLWMRSILNIGTPLEQWLEQIANLFEQQNSPEEFLGAVVEELITLPWITGAIWRTSITKGHFGEVTKHETEINTENLTICIYSHAPVGGALFLHCKLLVQIIDNFYEAKLREKKLTQQTHLQAIYETGARVTHDIKNLLQSLHAITSITTHSRQDEDLSVSQKLLEKQLPHLTQRLQLALDKLQAPEVTSKSNVYVQDWWRDLQTRSNLTNIEFQSDISEDSLIPAELFDSVIENLLENLKEKTRVESDLKITVSLYAYTKHLSLLVSDSGTQIPVEMASVIFKDPVKSNSGLGIGLYQAARQAESMGYSLGLENNEDGRVCFELRKQAA
jgi:signal transduction histidine kinase